MASTGNNSASFNVDSAYAQSFGALPNHTVISNPTEGIDLKSKLASTFEVGLKAHGVTSGGAGTAGYAMIPVYVDPKIVDLTRKRTPIVEVIPRVTNKGMYADYNVITAKGGAFAEVEDASLSETNTTYDRKSTAIKFLYSVGRVTGQSIAAQPAYMLQGMESSSAATGPFNDQSASNSKQQEVIVKARELRELEENMIINGNATTSAIGSNPNGSEFDGIVTTMGTTNKVDKNSSALALGDVDTAVKYAYDDGGRPNFAIADSGSYSDLLGLLNQRIGYMQSSKDMFWGFSVITLNTMVGEIPIIPSMFLTNSSGSKSIYFLDLSVVEMRVLQDMTYQELAKTNDSDKFMLKVYETLIIRAPTYCSFIGEIL
jgi:hypothetical protein